MGIVSSLGSRIGGLFGFGNRNPSAANLQFGPLRPSLYETNLSQMLEGSEYDPSLVGRSGVQTYIRMREEDSRIAAALTMLKEPIYGATWEVEASSDGVRLFVEEELGLSPDTRPEDAPGPGLVWDQLLTELLTALEIGFSLHELLWATADEGRERLRVAAFQPQLSISDFLIDDRTFELDKVKQIKKLFPREEVEIMADRLAYNSYSRMGADYWGKSILRAIYRDFYAKESLMLISLVAAKRHAIPPLHIQYRQGLTPAQQQKVIAAWQMISSDKASTIATPFGKEDGADDPDFSFSFLDNGKRTPQDLLPIQKYHDERMSQRLGVMFIDLGTSSSGSRALGDTFSDLMLNSIEALCDKTAEALNKQVVNKIVEMNFPGESAKVTWGNLTHLNIAKLIEAWGMLAQRYKVPLTQDDQNRFREGLRMAPTEEEETLYPNGGNQNTSIPSDDSSSMTGTGTGTGTGIEDEGEEDEDAPPVNAS